MQSPELCAGISTLHTLLLAQLRTPTPPCSRCSLSYSPKNDLSIPLRCSAATYCFPKNTALLLGHALRTLRAARCSACEGSTAPQKADAAKALLAAPRTGHQAATATGKQLGKFGGCRSQSSTTAPGAQNFLSSKWCKTGALEKELKK